MSLKELRIQKSRIRKQKLSSKKDVKLIFKVRIVGAQLPQTLRQLRCLTSFKLSIGLTNAQREADQEVVSIRLYPPPFKFVKVASSAFFKLPVVLTLGLAAHSCVKKY